MGFYTNLIYSFYKEIQEELKSIEQQLENVPDTTQDLFLILTLKKREIVYSLDSLYDLYKTSLSFDDHFIPFSDFKLKSLAVKHKLLKRQCKKLKLKNKNLKKKIIELEDRIEEDIPYMLRTR